MYLLHPLHYIQFDDCVLTACGMPLHPSRLAPWVPLPIPLPLPCPSPPNYLLCLFLFSGCWFLLYLFKRDGVFLQAVYGLVPLFYVDDDMSLMCQCGSEQCRDGGRQAVRRSQLSNLISCYLFRPYLPLFSW